MRSMRRLGCWACSCGLCLAVSVWGAHKSETFTPGVVVSPKSLPVSEDVEGSPLPRPEVNRIGSVPMGKFDVESKFKPGKYFVEGQNVSVGGIIFSFRNCTEQFPFSKNQLNDKTGTYVRLVDDDALFVASAPICDKPVSSLVVRLSHFQFSSGEQEWKYLHQLGEKQPRYLAKLIMYLTSNFVDKNECPDLIVLISENNVVSVPLDLLYSQQIGIIVDKAKLEKELTYFWNHNFLSLVDSPKLMSIFSKRRECGTYVRSLLGIACREEPSIWIGLESKTRAIQRKLTKKKQQIVRQLFDHCQEIDNEDLSKKQKNLNQEERRLKIFLTQVLALMKSVSGPFEES